MGDGALHAKPRLSLTRTQILAFRRHVGALDERLPRGRRSLRRAAWAGLQDSMPRAALLSIHARVEGTAAVHLGGPVAGPALGAAVPRLRRRGAGPRGLLAREAAGRCRARRVAEDLAARLHAHLDGASDDLRRGGARARRTPEPLRYAAPTGTVADPWDGARQPTVWTVPPPEIDPRERAPRARAPVPARLRPRPRPRRSPSGRDRAAAGVAAFDALAQVADRRAHADRRRVDPHPRRADVPRRPGARGARAAPPQRRRLLPPSGGRSRAPGSRRRPSCARSGPLASGRVPSSSRARSSGPGDALAEGRAYALPTVSLS